MKKKYWKYIFTGLLVIPLITTGFLSFKGIISGVKEALGEEASYTSPYPTAHSYGYYLMSYTRFGDYGQGDFPEYSADEVKEFWVNHHDLLVAWKPSHFKEINSEKEAFVCSNLGSGVYYNYDDDELYYDAILSRLKDWVDNNWQNYDWSSNFSSAEEAFEDCWLHVLEETTFSFRYGDDMTIPAYDSNNPKLSRMPVVWQRNSGWEMNMKSEVYRSFWADYYLDYLFSLEENNSADGIFFDVQTAIARRDMSQTVEFENNKEYEDELEELLLMIRSELDTINSDLMIAGNTWRYFEDYYEGGEANKFLHQDINDVHLREGAIIYTIDKNSLKREIEQSYQVGNQGEIVLMQHWSNSFYTGSCKNVYSQEACLARDRIAGLATYYMAMNDNVYFHSHFDPASDPYSCWFEAITYDIGQPTGEYYIFDQGQDPSEEGDSYEIWAREFTKGLVLIKPSPTKESSHLSDSITTHALPGTYRSLNSDGTLGPKITEISLKNWEGAILLEEDTIAPAAINDLTAN